MDDVPVRPGATVMILDERPDLHVLMVERSARLAFAGSMWAFPGGRVDARDTTEEADAVVAGLTDADASAALGLDRGGIAWWVAALRETFEEAGVLLTTDGSVPPGDVDALRRGVNDGTVDFVSMVAGSGLTLDGTGVHYVARWITPPGPPRRFDARFFVTAMPAGQHALHDDGELVAHRWVRPGDALAGNRRGEFPLFMPQVAMLSRLARFRSAAEAMAAAAGAGPHDDETVRVHLGGEPGDELRGEPGRVVFPSDPDYDSAGARVEQGTIRWPEPRR